MRMTKKLIVEPEERSSLMGRLSAFLLQPGKTPVFSSYRQKAFEEIGNIVITPPKVLPMPSQKSFSLKIHRNKCMFVGYSIVFSDICHLS